MPALYKQFLKHLSGIFNEKNDVFENNKNESWL